MHAGVSGLLPKEGQNVGTKALLQAATPLLRDNCGSPNHHNSCSRAKAEVVLLAVTPEKSFSRAASANGMVKFGPVFITIIHL